MSRLKGKGKVEQESRINGNMASAAVDVPVDEKALSFLLVLCYYAIGALLWVDNWLPTPENGGVELDRAYIDWHRIAARPHLYNSQANNDVRVYIHLQLKSLFWYTNTSSSLTTCNIAYVSSSTVVYFEGSDILVKVNGILDFEEVLKNGTSSKAILLSLHTHLRPYSLDHGRGSPHTAHRAFALSDNETTERKRGKAVFFDRLLVRGFAKLNPYSNMTDIFVSLSSGMSYRLPVCYHQPLQEQYSPSPLQPVESLHPEHTSQSPPVPLANSETGGGTLAGDVLREEGKLYPCLIQYIELAIPAPHEKIREGEGGGVVRFQEALDDIDEDIVVDTGCSWVFLCGVLLGRLVGFVYMPAFNCISCIAFLTVLLLAPLSSTVNAAPWGIVCYGVACALITAFLYIAFPFSPEVSMSVTFAQGRPLYVHRAVGEEVHCSDRMCTTESLMPSHGRSSLEPWKRMVGSGEALEEREDEDICFGSIVLAQVECGV
ncbi:hypothetical protein BDQ17DRAFT_1339776 [Cyathus striatus]|nr:hypothetical protein BDQ17DRAFT_1339776 [Cyathus striatus]